MDRQEYRPRTGISKASSRHPTPDTPTTGSSLRDFARLRRSRAGSPRKTRAGKFQEAKSGTADHSCRRNSRPKTGPMFIVHLTRRCRGFFPLAVTILLASGCAPTQPTPSMAVRQTAPMVPGSSGARHAEIPSSAKRLAWPLDDGYISSEFGNQRSGHRHRGIDIRISPGTSIRAAAAGRVTFSGRMRGYGNVIFVDHGDGFETRYAHNRKNRVHKGDVVDVGSSIAEVGSTGNASAPHLHFEVRKDGHAIDPLSFLPASSISNPR